MRTWLLTLGNGRQFSIEAGAEDLDRAGVTALAYELLAQITAGNLPMGDPPIDDQGSRRTGDQGSRGADDQTAAGQQAFRAADPLEQCSMAIALVDNARRHGIPITPDTYSAISMQIDALVRCGSAYAQPINRQTFAVDDAASRRVDDKGSRRVENAASNRDLANGWPKPFAEPAPQAGAIAQNNGFSPGYGNADDWTTLQRRQATAMPPGASPETEVIRLPGPDMPSAIAARAQRAARLLKQIIADTALTEQEQEPLIATLALCGAVAGTPVKYARVFTPPPATAAATPLEAAGGGVADRAETEAEASGNAEAGTAVDTCWLGSAQASQSSPSRPLVVDPSPPLVDDPSPPLVVDLSISGREDPLAAIPPISISIPAPPAASVTSSVATRHKAVALP